jgi:hypothetical protein
MADQLISYEIAIGIFAYLVFSLFYIRRKYTKKRSRKVDTARQPKINWMDHPRFSQLP